MANHHLMIYITINIITIYYHIIIIYYKVILPLLILYCLFFSVVIILPLRLPSFTLCLPRKSWGSPRERRKYFGVHPQQLRSLRETVPWMPWKWEKVEATQRAWGFRQLNISKSMIFICILWFIIYIYLSNIFFKATKLRLDMISGIFFCGGVMFLLLYKHDLPTPRDHGTMMTRRGIIPNDVFLQLEALFLMAKSIDFGWVISQLS